MASCHPLNEEATLHERVSRVLQDAIDFKPPYDGINEWGTFRTNDAFDSWDDPLRALTKGPLSEEERSKKAKALAKEWCRLFTESRGHLERLDDAVGKRLDFRLKHVSDIPDNLVRRATELLERIPTYAEQHRDIPPDTAMLKRLDAGFFVAETKRNYDKTTHRLMAAHFVDSNSIKVALKIFVALKENVEKRQGYAGTDFETYIAFVAEILRATLEMAKETKTRTAQLFVLRSFLWQTWRRCTVLHRWYVLLLNIHWGRSIYRNSSTTSTGRQIKRLEQYFNAPHGDIQGMKLPDYMCKWSFELLRTNRAATGLDFSYFIAVYGAAFGGLPARCIVNPDGSTSQCSGRSPGQCLRFTGARIEDQSSHATTCGGFCQRLFWDESSYRSVRGARAVRVDQAENGFLKYCTASTDTIAISHVWSHGQGGRPEKAKGSTGFNTCLHKRYSRIARRFACRSYWMDTPCIPQDHQLRKEAIAEINNVFRSCRFTLICDRDIMRIDVSKNRTVYTDEMILAALLVCDWNVRAWTLLEGYKGADNVYLLCKDDEVVSLVDVVKAVHAKGNIVLSALFLTMDHLFPKTRKPGKKQSAEKDAGPDLETSACLLTHRHASRPGDQIVIWSLLRGNQVSFTAEDFWRDPSSYQVNTAFLMSDAPRISGIKGLSWAPAQPDLPLEIEAAQDTKVRHFADEGNGSEPGRQTVDGLRAKWLVCELKDGGFREGLLKAIVFFAKGMAKVPSATIPKQFTDEILNQTSYFWHMGALSLSTRKRLREIAFETGTTLENMGLLRPVEGPPYFDTVPFTLRGDGDGTLVAVVERNSEGNWSWKRVYEWNNKAPLPPFRCQKRVLIQ